MRTYRRFVSVLMTISLLFVAQEKGYAQMKNPTMEKSVSDLMLVAGFGTGGAVLGLSTLPFYGEPGDHLKNILIGGAIGIIIGVGWVMVGQASDSKNDYYKGSQYSPSDYERYLVQGNIWRQGLALVEEPVSPLSWHGPIFTF